jgi:hypothetical protein
VALGSRAGFCRDDLPLPSGHPRRRVREELRSEVVDYLQEQAPAGVMVEGAVDEPLADFRVVGGSRSCVLGSARRGPRTALVDAGGLSAPNPGEEGISRHLAAAHQRTWA